MIYKKTIEGTFVVRENRFVARVLINGKEETVHVKNTGRCRELLIEGARVILEISDNSNRKTKWDLVSVYKEGLGWVNIDSQAPNVIVKEWLESGESLFGKDIFIKSEYVYGESRIDFYVEDRRSKILLEVKGCTLEIEGVGYFPDAPTKRGAKHLRELAKATKEGYDAYAVFVIAMPKVEEVLPNAITDKEFAMEYEAARLSGVKIIYLCCDVKPEEMGIRKVIVNNLV